MHYGKSLISVFEEFFASISKIFILSERLDTRLSFYKVLRFSWYILLVLRLSVLSRSATYSATWQLFITNNCASFHLWWKRNLVEDQKASKYYENNCININIVNTIITLIFMNPMPNLSFLLFFSNNLLLHSDFSFIFIYCIFLLIPKIIVTLLQSTPHTSNNS